MLPVFLKTFALYYTLFLLSVEIYHICSEIFGRQLQLRYAEDFRSVSSSARRISLET